MKWFKHMTASWDDEKLASLVGKGGDSGLALYGAFWRIAEIVAKQMDNSGQSASVKYPAWRWCQLLFVRKSYLCSILLRLQKEGLLGIEGDPNTDSTLIVNMPNLLKYRDEYSQKSRHTPKDVGSKNRTEGDTDKEEDKKQIPSSRAPRSRVAKKSDSRHSAFKEILEAYWNSKNEDRMPWDGSEAAALSKVLAASPDLTAERFKRILSNRWHSEVTHSERPRIWLGTVMSYAAGPLDRFGKPKPSSGGNNGKSQQFANSKQGRTIDATLSVAQYFADRDGARNDGAEAAGSVGGGGAGELHRGVSDTPVR